MVSPLPLAEKSCHSDKGAEASLWSVLFNPSLVSRFFPKEISASLPGTVAPQSDEGAARGICGGVALTNGAKRREEAREGSSPGRAETRKRLGRSAMCGDRACSPPQRRHVKTSNSQPEKALVLCGYKSAGTSSYFSTVYKTQCSTIFNVNL